MFLTEMISVSKCKSSLNTGCQSENSAVQSFLLKLFPSHSLWNLMSCFSPHMRVRSNEDV